MVSLYDLQLGATGSPCVTPHGAATPRRCVRRAEGNRHAMDAVHVTDEVGVHRTRGGIPVRFRVEDAGFLAQAGRATRDQLALHLTLGRLQLLRGFDQLLCLDGIHGVEHLPHQIETVRKVLRRFRGRVLLADEVGLGKTIEACLLLREYLLRGLARRVLILVPNSLVTQWQDELEGKFGLDFTVPPRTATSSRPEFWQRTDRVLVSTSFAAVDCARRRSPPPPGTSSSSTRPITARIPKPTLAARQLATTTVHVPADRHAGSEQSGRAVQSAHVAGTGPLADREGVQAAVCEAWQPARPAKPPAAARVVGRSHDSQHAQPGADRFAAALRPDDRRRCPDRTSVSCTRR